MVDILLTGEVQQEAERLKAEIKEHRALRKKKVFQKANEKAGKETDSKHEFEPWVNPTASFFIIIITAFYLIDFIVHLPGGGY